MVIAVGTHAPVAVPRIRTMVTANGRNNAHDRNNPEHTLSCTVLSRQTMNLKFMVCVFTVKKL
jgi:hypothetical protein